MKTIADAGAIMIYRFLLGLLLSIAAADSAFAQGKAVTGYSSYSCGQWQQFRTAKDVGSFQLEACIVGVLSGYNLASEGPDFLISAPHDKNVSIYMWIDNYCRGKPLDTILQATLALKDELLARTR